MSKLPIKRYYIIKNEYMLYYKSQKSEKPKGLISLFQCSSKLCPSKLKNISHCLKI